MRITDVEAFYLRLPQVEARTDSSQDCLLIKVSTAAGICGWGEVDGCPSVTKAVIEAPYSHTMVTGLKTLLVGENPLETSRLWQEMYRATSFYGRGGAVIQAMAGVDVALGLAARRPPRRGRRPGADRGVARPPRRAHGTDGAPGSTVSRSTGPTPTRTCSRPDTVPAASCSRSWTASSAP